MRFSSPKPRRRSEPALPMINVVFLLLIFFLMSAQIMPPSPFEVAPPEADVIGTPAEELRLYVSAQGEIALSGGVSVDAWSDLTAIETPKETPLLIRADASLPASDLAQILTRLSSLGFGNIDLAVARK